jgi:hypothetical protein
MNPSHNLQVLKTISLAAARSPSAPQMCGSFFPPKNKTPHTLAVVILQIGTVKKHGNHKKLLFLLRAYSFFVASRYAERRYRYFLLFLSLFFLPGLSFLFVNINMRARPRRRWRTRSEILCGSDAHFMR